MHVAAYKCSFLQVLFLGSHAMLSIPLWHVVITLNVLRFCHNLDSISCPLLMPCLVLFCRSPGRDAFSRADLPPPPPTFRDFDKFDLLPPPPSRCVHLTLFKVITLLGYSIPLSFISVTVVDDHP